MAQKLLHYDVLEKLGEGARSTIYAVRDPNTHQIFALKHVIRADSKDYRFIEQMQTEYDISRLFNHPNLRRSYDLKLVKTFLLRVNEAFLIMEKVEGRPLDVRPPGAMMDIVDTFVQTAQGLKAMHQMGFVHCDLKPNNILRDDRGKVKIIDFGQSCKIGTVKPRIQGTPDYIAPEQVNRGPISAQTDVYNFGATLYWSLTGKNIPTLYTVNKKGEHSFLLDSRIETPQELNAKVPTALSNLVMDCIASRQQKRPADMDAVITRLELGRHILLKQQGTAPAPSAELELSPDDTDHGI